MPEKRCDRVHPTCRPRPALWISSGRVTRRTSAAVPVGSQKCSTKRSSAIDRWGIAGSGRADRVRMIRAVHSHRTPPFRFAGVVHVAGVARRSGAFDGNAADLPGPECAPSPTSSVGRMRPGAGSALAAAIGAGLTNCCQIFGWRGLEPNDFLNQSRPAGVRSATDVTSPEAGSGPRRESLTGPLPRLRSPRHAAGSRTTSSSRIARASVDLGARFDGEVPGKKCGKRCRGRPIGAALGRRFRFHANLSRS